MHDDFRASNDCPLGLSPLSMLSSMNTWVRVMQGSPEGMHLTPPLCICTKAMSTPGAPHWALRLIHVFLPRHSYSRRYEKVDCHVWNIKIVRKSEKFSLPIFQANFQTHLNQTKSQIASHRHRQVVRSSTMQVNFIAIFALGFAALSIAAPAAAPKSDADAGR